MCPQAIPPFVHSDAAQFCQECLKDILEKGEVQKCKTPAPSVLPNEVK